MAPSTSTRFVSSPERIPARRVSNWSAPPTSPRRAAFSKTGGSTAFSWTSSSIGRRRRSSVGTRLESEARALAGASREPAGLLSGRRAGRAPRRGRPRRHRLRLRERARATRRSPGESSRARGRRGWSAALAGAREAGFGLADWRTSWLAPGPARATTSSSRSGRGRAAGTPGGRRGTPRSSGCPARCSARRARGASRCRP